MATGFGEKLPTMFKTLHLHGCIWQRLIRHLNFKIVYVLLNWVSNP